MAGDNPSSLDKIRFATEYRECAKMLDMTTDQFTALIKYLRLAELKKSKGLSSEFAFPDFESMD